MIQSQFLQRIKLIQFSGGLTYNTNGYAVLPDYSIKKIYASVQPVSRSEIRFLPEGTHYADFINIFTDFQIDVDNNETNLGDYFIWNNFVYKIYSSQSFKQFRALSTNHIECMVSRDNRLIYDPETDTINLPYPQIDSSFVPLFELITLVGQCFPVESPSPGQYPYTIPIIWGYQQELRPAFPYCMVNIEAVRNIDNTNYVAFNYAEQILYKSKSTVLSVAFNFYAYDKISSYNLMETFKLTFENYSFSSNKIAFLGFEEDYNELNEELYEDRTIFNAKVKMKFSLIVEQTQESTMSINTAAASLSFST